MLKEKLKEEKEKEEQTLNKQNNSNEDNNSNNIDTIFNKTIKNTSSVLFFSMISKIINILCNIILVRHISKEAYGTANIHLELLFSLICTFPIDTIRKTSQKFCPDKDTKIEQKKYYIVCQLYILIYIKIIICCFILFLGFIIFNSSETMQQNYIHLIIYIISAFLELLAEPIIIYMNLNMENILMGKTFGNCIRIVSNVIFVLYFKFDLGSFTCARFVGSFCYLCYFLFLGKFKYRINYWNFIPKNIKIFFSKKDYLIDEIDIRPLKSIFCEFVGSTLLNMILSKCENVILSFISKESNEEKSEYSFIVENFGTITNLILRPSEDTFYNLINKLKNLNQNDKNEKNTKSRNDDLIFEVLNLFIKFFCFFGILLISYYFLCGNDLIELVYSKKWATNITEKIGCSYAIYISIIAINGIIECFANATNDSSQMKLSYILLTSNSIFLVILMLLISNWDICSSIFANGISMVLRIIGNLYIIFCGKKENLEVNDEDKKYKNNLLFDIKNFQKKCFMSNYSIFCTIILVFIGKWIKKYFEYKRLLLKIGIYGFLGIINVSLIFLFEFKNVKNSLKKIKGIKF